MLILNPLVLIDNPPHNIGDTMDYLDPKKEARHRILLFAGYGAIAVAIGLTALVLLYQAYGFGVTRNGDVIQNGLAFFSSQPNPASITINNKATKYSTNTRIALPSAIYDVQLNRDGYHTWQRKIEIIGGGVQHFDYPFLIPTQLDDSKIHSYPSAPGVSTQSPDRRWLVINQPANIAAFDVYDLKSPEKAPLNITLPANLLTKATTSQSWKFVTWASDNQHILFEHVYDGKSEFILIDRTAADQARNLNSTLSANPTKVTLDDKKYDKYYLYNQSTATLQTATLSEPTPVTAKTHVLAYQSYGSDTLLYATDIDAPAGKVNVNLEVGDKKYLVRRLPAGTNYLLDLTKYSDKLYVAAGATNLNKVYVYKDPIAQINSQPKNLPAPVQVLRVDNPDFLSFSNSAQFIMAEHGTQFGIYDIENKHGYNYTATQQLDPPATHATWMDGNRLTYVSGGKTLIFDYDYANPQVLQPASSSYLPAFSPDYKFMYTLRNITPAPQMELMQTSLRAPADR